MSNKPLRVDWLLLKARMTAAGKNPAAVCLFCLTEAGRHLILSIVERLQWEATYRVEGYDFSDWDTLQDYVEDTIAELSMADCSSIVTEITNAVTNNVQTIVNQAQYFEDACCYLESQPTQTPPPSTNPMPPDVDDLGDLCKQAQAAHDGGQDFLSHLFSMANAGIGLTAGLLAVILALYFWPLAFVLVGVFLAFVAGLVQTDFTDEAELIWGAIKHDVVCAIVTATSATAAKAAVDSVIDSEVAPQSQITADLFKLMYSQAAINKIWDREFETGGYSATYCEDCQEWDTIGGYAYQVTNWSEPSAGRLKVGSWGDTMPLNNTWHGPGSLPEVVCDVLPELSAHLYGDHQLTNFNPDFVTGSQDQYLSMGIQSTSGAIGEYMALYEEFKLLVSSSANPGQWYWLSAYVRAGDTPISGEFEVTEGFGGSAYFYKASMPGASTFSKQVELYMDDPT